MTIIAFIQLNKELLLSADKDFSKLLKKTGMNMVDQDKLMEQALDSVLKNKDHLESMRYASITNINLSDSNKQINFDDFYS